MFLLVLCIKFCIIAVILTMLGFLLGMGYLVLGGVNLGDGLVRDYLSYYLVYPPFMFKVNL